MLQSKLFYKTSKITPKEAEAPSHKFLLKGGFIDQTMAGVYTFLPLGFRVLKKIEYIIRKNMEARPINGQEILMPALTPKENWQKTGRWENFGALFKLKGAGGKEYALGATHEEIVAPLAKKVVFSYKDLPFALFQIQTKFRNELRVKSGLLRTKEFIMKDLYSFHTDEKDLDAYYQKVAKSYLNIFKECGIYTEKGKDRITYQTWASGGTFSKYSHEYQTVTDFGEDIIYICKKCYAAINKEIKDKVKTCPNTPCDSSGFERKRAIEIGNIFKLGTKYSLPFDLKFRHADGKERPVIMGCYGLGLGRMMGAIVERHYDKKGIIWPKEVSPFLVHLIQIENNQRVKAMAEKIYDNLSSFVGGGQKTGFEVLYDDREEKTAGEKFAEADLIGIPFRVVVSERTLEKNSVELKERNKNKTELVKIKDLVKLLN